VVPSQPDRESTFYGSAQILSPASLSLKMVTGARPMPNTRLLLCLRAESQEHVQMALDYWAGFIEDGVWVWTETVKQIASRYNLKDSILLQSVREAATAFDLSTRCSSEDHDTPRALSCRGDLRIACARDFICEECRYQLQQERLREEQERAKALLSKKKTFLASLIARTTSLSFTTSRSRPRLDYGGSELCTCAD
jgi:hypothetical protein